MKNKYISRTLKLLALIIPLIFIFIFSQEFLFAYQDYNTLRIEEFYNEEENSHDVVFMGASEIFTGFSPGYAYEKYGFTSYMYAMDANQGSLYLSQLKEILNRQSPQVLFVDVYGFLRADDSILFDEARMRIYVENIPFSLNKVQTIMEHPYEDKLSCFLPLIMHHGDLVSARSHLADVYKRLTRPTQPSSLKGMVTRTTIYSGSGDRGEPFDPAVYRLTDNSRAYLVEFLEYCKDNNLDNIVFINFPRCIEDENNHSLLTLLGQAKEIIGQYDYPLLDLQKEMDVIGIDKSRDYYNEHHLNVYGQLKLTEYLGIRLLDEYGITPREQSPRNKQEWETCASNTQEYFEMADQAIKSENDMVISEAADTWLFRERK